MTLRSWERSLHRSWERSLHFSTWGRLVSLLTCNWLFMVCNWLFVVCNWLFAECNAFMDGLSLDIPMPWQPYAYPFGYRVEGQGSLFKGLSFYIPHCVCVCVCASRVDGLIQKSPVHLQKSPAKEAYTCAFEPCKRAKWEWHMNELCVLIQVQKAGGVCEREAGSVGLLRLYALPPLVFLSCSSKFTWRSFSGLAATQCNTLQHGALHCATLHHSAIHCNTVQHSSTHCNTPQHTATLCNTLQHTATHWKAHCVMCETWLIHLCHMTHPYVWHGWFICVT